jgi:hypothetical protein
MNLASAEVCSDDYLRKGIVMGDKGGKKDKDKSQKQKAAKQATKQKGKGPAK